MPAPKLPKTGEQTVKILISIPTIEEYIQLVYPAPPDDKFFQSWGYEHWLIKTQKHDIEQMSILLRHDYNLFRLSHYLMWDGYNPDGINKGALTEWGKGKPIVRAKREIKRFLHSPAAKDTPGILLHENEDGTHFCIMACKILGVFPPILHDLTDEEIDITEVLYKSDEQINELYSQWVSEETE